MDDPAISLFQVNNLDVISQQNQEEAEDLEEQAKRGEEIQHLLMNALDDYKYDDSTIDSISNPSICFEDDRKYKIHSDNSMYDVQAREIEQLKNEYEAFKTASKEEIDALKRKLTVSEAETHQVQISLRSTKSLLEEKLEEIMMLNQQIAIKDEKIMSLDETVKELQYDIQAYSNQIKEFQMKTHMSNGAFNLLSSQADAEELRKIHNKEIDQLRQLLTEHQKKSELFYREIEILRNDLKNSVDTKNENEQISNSLIISLTKNCQSAQDQCKELLNVLEILSNENEHFKSKLQKYETFEPLSTSYKSCELDIETLKNHNERLRQILSDKDTELSSLKAKAKFYENDMSELLEYREIKTKTLPLIECNNVEHSTILMILQEQTAKLKENLELKHMNISELHEQISVLEKNITDRNKSFTNKEKECDDLNKQLKESHNKLIKLQISIDEQSEVIKRLTEENKNIDLKYLESRNVIESLQKVIDNNKLDFEGNIDLKTENDTLKLQLEEMESVKLQLEVLKKEYGNLSKTVELPLNSNQHYVKNMSVLVKNMNELDLSLQPDVLKIKLIGWSNLLKVYCKEVIQVIDQNVFLENEIKSLRYNLNKSQEEIARLTNLIEEINSAKVILEGERACLDFELNTLREEVKKAKLEIEQMLQEPDDNCKEIDKMESKEKNIKQLENEISELKKKINEYEEKSSQLMNMNKVNSNCNENGDMGSEIEIEVLIREKLQKEYERKINKIETEYKNILQQSNLKVKDIEKQEGLYKNQLSEILEKYAEFIEPLRQENTDLKNQLIKYKSDIEEMQKYLFKFQNGVSTELKKNQMEAHRSIDAWKLWAKNFVEGCLHIEKINAQSRESILNAISDTEKNVSSIEKYFEQKMKDYRKKNHITKGKI